jgi:hypothetical protein
VRGETIPSTSPLIVREMGGKKTKQNKRKNEKPRKSDFPIGGKCEKDRRKKKSNLKIESGKKP